MRRKRSQSTMQRDMQLLSMIKPIKSDHPLWGYRRIWSYLKYRQGYPVAINRVHRIMKENSMLVTPQVRLKAKRGPIKPKPIASKPNQFWGIDMTKIRMATWGWLYLTVVLDWYTKEIVGYSLSLQSKTDDWLNALEMAVSDRFPYGIREAVKEQRLFLISDNGCQPTSQRFMNSPVNTFTYGQKGNGHFTQSVLIEGEINGNVFNSDNGWSGLTINGATEVQSTDGGVTWTPA